jgi:hypothetical protein
MPTFENTQVLTSISLAETGRQGLLPWNSAAYSAGRGLWSPVRIKAPHHVREPSFRNSKSQFDKLQSPFAALSKAAGGLLTMPSKFRRGPWSESRSIKNRYVAGRTPRPGQGVSLQRLTTLGGRPVEQNSRTIGEATSSAPPKIISPRASRSSRDLINNAITLVEVPLVQRLRRNVVFRDKCPAIDSIILTRTGKRSAGLTKSNDASRLRHVLITRRSLTPGYQEQSEVTVNNNLPKRQCNPPNQNDSDGFKNLASRDAPNLQNNNMMSPILSGCIIIDGNDLSNWLDRHLADVLLLSPTGTTGPDARLTPPSAGSSLAF